MKKKHKEENDLFSWTPPASEPANNSAGPQEKERKKKDILKRRHLDLSALSEEDLNRIADKLDHLSNLADLSLGKSLLGAKDKDFYTVQDVMKIFSMSKVSVYRRCRDGTFPYIRFKQRIYFHRGVLYNKILSYTKSQQPY